MSRKKCEVFCEESVRKNTSFVTKHDTMKFLSLVLESSRPNKVLTKIKPSIYLQEMIMNPEERLQKVNKTLKMSPIQDFILNPPLVVFQNFEPGKQYNASLSIRNISKVSKQITVKCKPSEIFSLNFTSKVTSKLASGMSLQCVVRFCSQVDQDQDHVLTVVTDSGLFDIPLTALASRPLVNFPDYIELSETLVRVPCKKCIYVRNIGKIPAVFNLECEKPFSVSPDKCIIDIGEIAMITVEFQIDSVGDFFKYLSVQFESGEKIHIDLFASSKNGSIWLSNNKICMDDTYIGLKRQRIISLYNDSESTITFSWNKFETLQTDRTELERMKEKFNEVKNLETLHCKTLEYNEVITESDHSKVYSRILTDEISLVSPNDLRFSNKSFEIHPMGGELWPKGRCDITVTFTPDVSGERNCTAFCDVTGRDARLPLFLNGHGLGPTIKLNLRSLDIGPVFLGSHQSYEIIAANKGDIPGSVRYVEKQTMFGGTILCEPLCQCLEPYDVKSFILSFSSSRTGSFVEDLVFQITQSDEELQMSMRGSVVNPIISFDQLKLDFGVVPVGFPVTKNVNLVNQSQVPVTFALRMSCEGSALPVTCDDFALASSNKPQLQAHCREFTLSPITGIIEPNIATAIEVTLVTNSSRKNSSSLVVENKNSKLSQPVSLLVSYESRVAEVVCSPRDVNIKFCFVHFEYTKQITLTNSSSIPAYFFIPIQKTCSDYNIQYKTDISEGLLDPGESREITFNIVSLYVGRNKQDVPMMLFGKRDLHTLCTISCTAQGPNVSSNMETLNFGKLTLMETKTLSLDLSNDSPIDAEFTISAEEKHQARWEVDPKHGQLLPGQVVSAQVTLTVVDPGVINNILIVHVVNSRPVTVGLLASASGCGILINPTIFPELDLGYLFSRRLYQFTLTLNNPGSRHHLIQFTSDRASLKSTSAVPVNIFKITPQKFELEGGQETHVILEGQCNKEIEVDEHFVCWAVINKKGLKQKLGDVTIKASFIVPIVEVSEELLEFEINVEPNEEQGQISIKTLKLRSIANLPLTLILELNFPFLILEDEFKLFTETLINLNPEKEENVTIGFKPPFQQNSHSTSYSGVLHIRYQEHPQKDKVQLKGHLNFPNLQFSQHTLDFGCTPLDYQAHQEIVLVNPTPLPVTFSFAWDPSSVLTTYFEQESVEDLLGADLPDTLKYDPLHYNRFLESMKSKDSMTGPLPLIYVEPVPVHHATFPLVALDDVTEILGEDVEMHNVLFPIVEPYFSPEQPSPEFNILPEKCPSLHAISEVFDLAPTFGTLAPFQSQVLNVSFHPRAFMGAAVSAVCSVLGGPSETLRLSGQSARHIFSLSTTFINFGFRSFIEPCEDVIQLKNLSALPLVFKISSLCSSLLSAECNDLEVGKITVEPSYGSVASQSSVDISVKFFPGLAGEFQESFAVQIGHLEPVTVVVTGYGVMPQIFINNVTMARPKVPISWLYSAVASLTSPRFRHLVHGRLTPDLTITDHSLHGWLLIDYNDKLPSNEDIYLALERVIAHQYSRENTFHLPQMLRSSSKTIPQLQVPGYILDFGSVVIGTTTEMTLMVENRGFVRADVHLNLGSLEKKLKQDGVSVHFQNNVSLAVGRSVPLFLTLKPTSQRFKNTREMLHFTLQLEVIGGASVVIYCKALLTVPHIQVDQSIVTFGDVHCGHCVKRCILLKNSGEIEAECSSTLLKVKRRGKELPEHVSPFQITEPYGLFPPKTASYLEITFTPLEEKSYEYLLKLNTKHNSEKILVRLYGSGVEPKVVINPTTVQFGAHIPYSATVAREFTISNPCPFHVQVYFPDFDSEILEEDRMLRVLTHMYRSDKVLLPLEVYNAEVLPELRGMYEQLTDEARKVVRSAIIEASSQYSDSGS